MFDTNSTKSYLHEWNLEFTLNKVYVQTELSL